MTPSNHSPEADYPPRLADDVVRERAIRGGAILDEASNTPRSNARFYGEEFDAWLSAHDTALVAATHARQYAATRTAIAEVAARTLPQWWRIGEGPDVVVDTLALADALLATPGPLLDAAEVRRAALVEAQDALRLDGYFNPDLDGLIDATRTEKP